MTEAVTILAFAVWEQTGGLPIAQVGLACHCLYVTNPRKIIFPMATPAQLHALYMGAKGSEF